MSSNEGDNEPEQEKTDISYVKKRRNNSIHSTMIQPTQKEFFERKKSMSMDIPYQTQPRMTPTYLPPYYYPTHYMQETRGGGYGPTTTATTSAFYPVNVPPHPQHPHPHLHHDMKPGFDHSVSVDSETADFMSTIDFGAPQENEETPGRKRNRTRTKKNSTGGRSGEKQRRVKWSDIDIYTLWKTIEQKGNEWREIHTCLPTRTYHQVKDKGRRLLQQERWTTGRTKNDSESASLVAQEIASNVVKRMSTKDPTLETQYDAKVNLALQRGMHQRHHSGITLATLDEAVLSDQLTASITGDGDEVAGAEDFLD